MPGGILDSFADYAVGGRLDQNRETTVREILDVAPDRRELGEFLDRAGEPGCCEGCREETVGDGAHGSEGVAECALGDREWLRNATIRVWPQFDPCEPQGKGQGDEPLLGAVMQVVL